jgi:hypothetical protein
LRPPPANPIPAITHASPNCAALKLREFFIFATEQPRLNRGQMLSFYAFVGKLHTLLETVAAGRHYNLDKAGPSPSL